MGGPYALRASFLMLFGLSAGLLLRVPAGSHEAWSWPGASAGPLASGQRGLKVAQLTGPCALSAPSTPNPLSAGTYYPASTSGASVTVNGHTVGLDIYTPRSFAMPHTNNVLVFVYGGQFQALGSAPAAEVEGIGQALITDSSVNVLTVVPQYEKYTLPPMPWGGPTPPPPNPDTTPLAYEVPLDIGCTLAWIKQYSHEYGGTTAPQITLVGYSSGAGVVASVMLAANQFLPSPQATLSDVTGVLTMSGNYDYKKAEAGGTPFTVWYYIHGQPGAALETSPLEQGSPNPVSALNVPWIVEHEQCDADEHYSDAQRLTDALNGGWDQAPTYLYENTRAYTYTGYPSLPSLTTGAATHGDGQFALALVGSPLYNVMNGMIGGAHKTPQPVPTWEHVPLVDGVTAVNDVAVGQDSTIWVVTNNVSPTDANDFEVAKYADKANDSNFCVTVPDTDPGAAQNIAVDAYGDPWTASSPGHVSRLAGGLIAAQPTYPGIGTASTFAPASTPSALDIAGGGGTSSGVAEPPVYNHYPRNIGTVSITSTSATGGTPPTGDFLLQHYDGTAWVTNNTAWGVRLAVDPNGKAWLVLADGSVWTTESLPGCMASFCAATGVVASDIGTGGQYAWVVSPTAAAHELFWAPLASPTWTALVVPFTPARISVTPDGFPVAVDGTGNLWIYHPCMWTDGSPAGGGSASGPSAICEPISILRMSARKAKRP